MNPDLRHHLNNEDKFGAFPDHLRSWILKSEHASDLFSEFFKSDGYIRENKEDALPYYSSTEPPAIVVSAKQWQSLKAPDASQYPQWHMFGTLAHEIGHHRFNAATVPFTVQYSAAVRPVPQ